MSWRAALSSDDHQAHFWYTPNDYPYRYPHLLRAYCGRTAVPDDLRTRYRGEPKCVECERLEREHRTS
jgi:hypothetical protein